MAGYSGTPLSGKLGIKSGLAIGVNDHRRHLVDLLDPLPDGVTVGPIGPGIDLAVCFATDSSALVAAFEQAFAVIPADGAIWVTWPKRASKVPTDITEDRCRELFLPTGMVDVKVCAIDDTWSGLKFVVRKERRPDWGR